MPPPLELEKALPAIESPVKKDMAGSRFTRDLSKSNKKGDYPEIIPGIRDRVAQYSKADVDGARALYDKFGPLPEREWQIWLLDRTVNDRGEADCRH
jgi:hypothetical protein